MAGKGPPKVRLIQVKSADDPVDNVRTNFSLKKTESQSAVEKSSNGKQSRARSFPADSHRAIDKTTSGGENKTNISSADSHGAIEQKTSAGQNTAKCFPFESNILIERSRSRHNNVIFFPVTSPVLSAHEARIEVVDNSFKEVEVKFVKPAEVVAETKEVKVPVTKENNEKAVTNDESEEQKLKIKQLKKRSEPKKLQKNSVIPKSLIKSDKGKFESDTSQSDKRGVPDFRYDKTKTDKKKNEKTTKEKKTKDEPVAKQESATAEEERKQSVEVNKDTAQEERSAEGVPPDKKKKARKLPGCFGFISTWLAKRKQKRRDKKKKAIASRSGSRLAEHKQTKGGEAFVIEIETPKLGIHKPVLPPIKQKSGPIRRGTFERLKTAEERRAEELAKLTATASTYEKKRTKCKKKKRELDIEFRNKTYLNIREKQADAERNRYNQSRRTAVTKTRPISSTQSTSIESLSIEGDPYAFLDDVTYRCASRDANVDSDPDSIWIDNGVDLFYY